MQEEPPPISSTKTEADFSQIQLTEKQFPNSNIHISNDHTITTSRISSVVAELAAEEDRAAFAALAATAYSKRLGNDPSNRVLLGTSPVPFSNELESTTPNDESDDDLKKRRRRSSLLRRSLSSSSLSKTLLGGSNAIGFNLGRIASSSQNPSALVAAAALQDKKKRTRKSIALQLQRELENIIDDSDESSDEDEPKSNDEKELKLDAENDGRSINPATSATCDDPKPNTQLVENEITTGVEIAKQKQRPPHPHTLQKSGSFNSRPSKTIHTVVNPLDVTLRFRRNPKVENQFCYELCENHTGNNRVGVLVDLQLPSFLKLKENMEEKQQKQLIQNLNNSDSTSNTFLTSTDLSVSSFNANDHHAQQRKLRAKNRVCQEVVRTVEERWQGRFLLQVDQKDVIGYTLLSKHESILAVYDIFLQTADAEAATMTIKLNNPGVNEDVDALVATSSHVTNSQSTFSEHQNENTLQKPNDDGQIVRTGSSSLISTSIAKNVSDDGAVRTGSENANGPLDMSSVPTVFPMNKEQQDVHKSALASLERRKRRQYASAKISSLITGRALIKQPTLEASGNTTSSLENKSIEINASRLNSRNERYDRSISESFVLMDRPTRMSSIGMTSNANGLNFDDSLSLSYSSLPGTRDQLGYDTGEKDRRSDLSVLSLPAPSGRISRKNGRKGTASKLYGSDTFTTDNSSVLDNYTQFYSSNSSLVEAAQKLNNDVGIEFEPYNSASEGTEKYVNNSSKDFFLFRQQQLLKSELANERSCSTLSSVRPNFVDINDGHEEDDYEPYQTDVKADDIQDGLHQFQQMFALSSMSTENELQVPIQEKVSVGPSTQVLLGVPENCAVENVSGNLSHTTVVNDAPMHTAAPTLDCPVPVISSQQRYRQQPTYSNQYYMQSDLKDRDGPSNRNISDVANQSIRSVDLDRRPSVSFQNHTGHRTASMRTSTADFTNRRSNRLSEFSQGMIQELLLQLHGTENFTYGESDDE